MTPSLHLVGHRDKNHPMKGWKKRKSWLYATKMLHVNGSPKPFIGMSPNHGGDDDDDGGDGGGGGGDDE